MEIPAVAQARVLKETAGVRARDELQLVHISGEDRVAWLNGQVTSDVRGVKPGEGLYALAITVRGKIMADLWVLDRGEQLAVLLPKAAQASVLESFERQIIMEDVILTPDPSTAIISVQGPLAAEVVAGILGLETHRCDELGYGGLFVLVNETELQQRLQLLCARAAELGGGFVEEGGFQLARLRAGRAQLARDFDAQHYPQEAGLKRLAVSFNKGCYLGQEVVCMLENRGKLSRRLVRFDVVRGPEPRVGADVCDASGHAVGQLTSVATDPEAGHAIALGYVKSAHATTGTELRCGESVILVREAVGAD